VKAAHELSSKNNDDYMDQSTAYLNDREIFPPEKEKTINPGELNRIFRKLDKMNTVRMSVKTPNLHNKLKGSVF
jgi:predicted Ser/Thr protein kinase